MPRVTLYFRLSFWLCALFIFGLAVVPQPLELLNSTSDKVLHIIAFAVLAALAAFAFPGTSRLKLVALLSLFGAAIEVAQLIPSLNRDSDPADWLADTVSAARVAAAMAWWRDQRSLC